MCAGGTSERMSGEKGLLNKGLRQPTESEKNTELESLKNAGSVGRHSRRRFGFHGRNPGTTPADVLRPFTGAYSREVRRFSPLVPVGLPSSVSRPGNSGNSPELPELHEWSLRRRRLLMSEIKFQTTNQTNILSENEKRHKILEWFDAPKPNKLFYIVVLLAFFVQLEFAYCLLYDSIIDIFIFKRLMPFLLIFGGLDFAIWRKIREKVRSERSRYLARPTDKQMDEWLAEDINKLLIVARERCGIPKSDFEAIEPVKLMSRVHGMPPIAATASSGCTMRIKMGEDHIIRFMPIQVSFIIFAKRQLVAYRCTFDWYRNIPVNENVDEFFYEDIVSVSTQSKRMKFGRVQKDIEVFALTTSGGTGFEITLGDSANTDDFKIASFLQEPKDVVQAIRVILRQKRTGETSI